MLPQLSYGPNTTIPVKVLGNAYIPRKILKSDEKGQVVRGLYFKKTGWIGRCVLKEGKRGAFPDEHGRDMYARIRWQRELHENLSAALPLPKLISSFEDTEGIYLVLEYIAGKTLLQTIQKLRKNLHWQFITVSTKQRLLDYYLQIAQAIQCMHEKGYIHRDITATNFLVTSRDRVYVIDLELAYSWRFNDPTPAFALGTHGFMSPAQAEQREPVPEDDVYSLGALLILLTTGYEPIRIIEDDTCRMQEKLAFLVGDLEIVQLIGLCLQPNILVRPTLTELIEKIGTYRQQISLLTDKTAAFTGENLSSETLQLVIQRGLQAIMDDQLMTKDGLWFSEDKVERKQAVNLSADKTVFGGFNKGVSGVMYLLGMAKEAGFDVSRASSHIERAVMYLQHHFISHAGVAAGLHFGKAGAAIGLAAVTACKLLEPGSCDIIALQACLSGNSSWLNIAHGVAGQAAATMACQQLLMTNRLDPVLRDQIDYLLARQEKDGAWKIPIHQQGVVRTVKHLSYAYGNAGIIWVLLTYYQLYQYAPAGAAAARGLHWLGRHYSRKDQDVSYCNGAPGIALPFIKASEVLQAPEYRQQAEKILALIPEGVSLVNLSWCHGMAGIGMAYLQAFETWGDEYWWQRATWITRSLLQVRRTYHNEQYYWLVENRDYPTADLLVGNAGVLHFLIRYYSQGRLGQMHLPARILPI